MGKRGPQPTLTANDQKVLTDLYRTRCMTGIQLQHSAYGAESRYSKARLKVLRDRGLIINRFYSTKIHDPTGSFSEFKSSRFFYELTEDGVKQAEQILGLDIITGSSVEKARVSRSRSVSRYLKAAELYLSVKGQLEWMPHFMIRHHLNADDFTISCLAGVKNENKIVLLYGLTENPSLRALSRIRQNLAEVDRFGLDTHVRHLVLCSSTNDVDTAMEYFMDRSLDGELLIMTYQEAQIELPFVAREDHKDYLVSEIRKIYGQVPVQHTTGRHPAKFDYMVEHYPGKYAYLVDLSTGNLELFFNLVRYDDLAADQEARRNGAKRGVFALVRDMDQWERIKGYLTDHHSVRVLLRNSDYQSPWLQQMNGRWVRAEVKPVLAREG